MSLSRISSDRSTPTRPDVRLRRLERLCGELWHDEPLVDSGVRTRLLRQLAEIERWVTAMTLRLEVDPDSGRRVEQHVARYERRLDELAAAWQGAWRHSGINAERASA